MQSAHGTHHRTQRRIAYRVATIARDIIVLTSLVLPMPGSAQSTQHPAPDILAIERYVARHMARSRIPGVAIAIVSKDSVIYSRGFGTDGFGKNVTEHTGFVLGSMSKSITALAVMQLVERGDVALDAPVQNYLPWFRVAEANADANPASRITVRQLLLHTSGIPGNAPRATGASRTLTDQVRALADVTLHNAPGSTHEYASPNYVVLGAVLEAVTGRSFAEYVQQSIFTPLGMRDSRTEPRPALRDGTVPGADGMSSGHIYVFGFPVARTLPHENDRLPTASLISSAADMGVFLLAQMRGADGRDSGGVLSAAGFTQMHRGGAAAEGFSYAFGWRDGQLANTRAVHHGGIVPNFRGKLVMLPDVGVGVVVLTNVSSAVPWPIAPTSHVMADEIAASLVGVPLPDPSGWHRWLFGASALAMALLVVHQLRVLVSARRKARTAFSNVTDVVFAATVLFVIPRFAGISWREFLTTTPDVAWWLLIVACVSLGTVAVQVGRRPR